LNLKPRRAANKRIAFTRHRCVGMRHRCAGVTENIVIEIKAKYIAVTAVR